MAQKCNSVLLQTSLILVRAYPPNSRMLLLTSCCAQQLHITVCPQNDYSFYTNIYVYSATCISELFINGKITTNDWNNVATYGDVTVYNDSGAYALAFENEVVVKISASFKFELLTFSLILPPELEGNVAGLMGKS